jgi:hypothetical protein
MQLGCRAEPMEGQVSRRAEPEYELNNQAVRDSLRLVQEMVGGLASQSTGWAVIRVTQ